MPSSSKVAASAIRDNSTDHQTGKQKKTNKAKTASSSGRRDAALSEFGDDDRCKVAVRNSLEPKNRRIKKESKKSRVSKAVKRQSQSMRHMAEVIKRSLSKSDQSRSGSSGKNYAVALPSGMVKDVRGSVLATLLAMSMRELATHMKEEEEDYIHEKTCCEVEMIEAKTEDGGTRLVAKHRKGSSVLYKSQKGLVGALILDVHLDDLLEPYYTIKLPDGKEKQTDNAHIVMPDKTEKPVNDARQSDARSAKRDQRDPPEEVSKEYRKVKCKDNKDRKAEGKRGPNTTPPPKRDPPGDQPEKVGKSRRKSLSKLAKTLRGKKKA